jgi:hypothetical protein
LNNAHIFRAADRPVLIDVFRMGRAAAAPSILICIRHGLPQHAHVGDQNGGSGVSRVVESSSPWVKDSRTAWHPGPEHRLGLD